MTSGEEQGAVHAEMVQTGGIMGGGFGAAQAWLAQLRCGALSPDSAFAVVQELPNRQRPRAMQALLHDLSGDQILTLLTEATRYRVEGRKSAGHAGAGGRVSLLAVVARAAPCLPGFRDLCVGELLRHPTRPQEHAGLDCGLGLVINASPAADEAVAAFFDAGEDAVCSLLKW